MSQIVPINKEGFLSDLYNCSSYEEALNKIQKEKIRVEELKNSGKYVPIARLHLNLIKEIESYIKTGIALSDSDPNLIDRIAKIFNRFLK